MNQRLRIPVLCSTLCLMTSVLVGCGGSDDDASKNTDKVNTSAVATPATVTTQQASSNSPSPTTASLTVATTPQDNTPDLPSNLDNRPKLLSASMVEGTIAKELKAGLATGSSSNYDVLLFDQRDSLDGSNETKMKAALKDNKQVIVDMGPAGDARKAREATLRDQFGMSIDADAVMIQSSADGKGYYITPVDAAQKNAATTDSFSDAKVATSSNINAVSRLQTDAQASTATAQTSQNTVKAIFGL